LQLAAGTDANIIYIYTPNADSKKTEVFTKWNNETHLIQFSFTWSKLCQIKLDFRIQSVSWRPWGTLSSVPITNSFLGDRILVAGASLSMWQINYDKVCNVI
jgi:hypothetical protein